MKRNLFFERSRRSARATALDRPELREASAPRAAAAGPVSMAVKTLDPGTRALIDRAMARRAGR